MKVSVAVITYNQEAYIAQTLDSILAQKCDFNFEIVVGEDCSMDGTRRICLEYQNRYPDKIRMLLHEKNQGVVENYYQTMALCHGDYIAQVAGDDYFCDPLKLQKQVDFLEANAEYALIFGGMNKLDVETGTLSNAPPRPCSGWIFPDLMQRGNFVSAPTACFRRSMFERVDNAELRAQKFRSEDFPLWLALSREGKFHSMPDTLTVYRIAAGSVGNPRTVDDRILNYESNATAVAFFARKHAFGGNAFSGWAKAKYNYEILKILLKAGRRQEAKQLLSGLNGRDFFRGKILKAWMAMRIPFLQRLLFKPAGRRAA